jgi:hypothetical protein
MTPDEQAEAAAARMIEYYKELELLIALLIVKYGERHEGGFRFHLNDEDAWALRQRLGTTEPVVIQTYELGNLRYVIDVL